MKLKNEILQFTAAVFALFFMTCNALKESFQEEEIIPVIDVTVNEVITGSISKKVIFYGKTEVKDESIISSQFAGRLKDFSLYEGDKVDKEQKIAIIENEQAEALVQGTKDIKNPIIKDFIRNEIKDTYVISPIAGVIVEKYKNNGDVVSKGDPILKILDLSQFYLWGNLPSVYLNEVKTGQKTLINFEDIPGRTFTSKIELLEGEINTVNRTLRVRINLSNSHNLFRSGMFAKIEAIIQQKNHALLVPKNAILVRDNEKFLYTVDDGRAREVQVKTGIGDDTRVEIISGINEGDKVISLGNYELENGMQVKVLDK